MQNIEDTSTAQDSQIARSSENRRKRVNRIKKVIILVAILFLIMPTIFCIFLGIQINRLQNQMKVLMDLHSEYGLSYDYPDNENLAYAAEMPADFSDDGSVNKENQAQATDTNSVQDTSASDSNNVGQTEDITITDTVINSDKDHNTDNNVNNNDNNSNKETDKGTDSDTTKTSDQDKDIYKGKTVYLTFDDGPSIYTDDILDILGEYNVKATFFVIGKTDSNSKKMYQRIVDDGHTLGMHSYSHNYEKIYNSLEDFDKDFTKLWKLLYDTTGYKPSIYRFPGGSDNLVNKNGMDEFIRYLNDKSIVYFDWNVVNGDATGVDYTKEQLISNVLKDVAVKKTSIVLMHDSQSKETTLETLPGLLEKLISGGAKVLPLDKNVTPIQMIKANSIK